MLDISNGFLKISDELTIFPGFSFGQFKHTRFYKNQDRVKIIYLDEQQIIDNKKYITACLLHLMRNCIHCRNGIIN